MTNSGVWPIYESRYPDSSTYIWPAVFSGGSSDDSYLSADEEPAEGPRFERPLEDATASIGAEVTLKCIITGSPPPTGTATENMLYTVLITIPGDD